MKEFKIKLSSNVDELMAQFAAGSKELKEFAKNASMVQGEAEKLGILKETVAYISQMDKALSKLKKNQPDIFKQIFGSVDKDMRAAMQPLMQMPKEIGTLITKIGKQLDGIRSGKIEATNSEMKALGETFRGVAKALNMEVDLSFLDGTSKAKVKADKLTASMEQLAKAYYNVHKAEVSTGLSLTLPDEPKKKRTKKSSGKGTASSRETPTISNSGGIKTVETLTNSYTKLRKEVEKIKGGEDIDGIIKAFKIAEDELDRLENILYNVDEPLGQTMAKMREFLGTKFPEMSLKDVENSVQRFLDIQKELDNVQTDEGFDRLSNEADQIRDEFYQLSSATENIFDGLTDNLTLDDAVKQLSNLLGIDVVQSAQSAGDAAAGIEVGLKESGQAAEDATAKVKVLENAISEVIRNAGKHKLEFSVVLNGEDVTVRKGASATATDIVEDVGNMMSSLGKYFIDSHVHTTTSTMTDDADLKYFASLKKYGVTNHNAIMGPDGATLYDFSQVSDSDMEKAIKMVKELRKSGVASREEVENIFKSLNSGYDVIKSFDASQMGEFAQYIYDISKNAQASIDPLNQFKAIINHLTDGKIDLNKYSKLFEDFKPENAKSIFDQIVNTETNGQPDMYDFSKKSMADVISELASANVAGQQLVQTLTNVGQVADGASASINNLGDEVDEALAQETGNLESKLERLRDLAEEYGMQITQRDRNSLESLTDQDNEKELTGAKADRFYELQEKVDAADESLMAFGEQYDKIILKLENGKKVEILPDDKGLRDLYKFMDEGDGRAFNGIDVSDIEFVRKAIESANAAGQQLETTLGDMRQAGEAAGQGTGASIDELNAKIEKEKQLTQEVVELQRQLESVPANPVDASELESAQREIKNLREEALVLEGALDGWKSSYYDAQNALDNSIPVNEVENMVPNDVVDEYRNKVIQLTNESTQLKEILAETQSLLMETQKDLESADKGGVGDSFSAESDTVKTNVQAEIKELKRLEDKIFDVKHAVEQKIQAFVNERKAVDSNVGAEIDQLEKLRKKLEEIAEQVTSIGKINLGADSAGDINSHVTVDGFEQLTSSISNLKSSIDNAVALLRTKSGSGVTENPHMLTDPQGRIVTAYRGIHDAYGGLVSGRYHGGTFSTDDFELAKSYAGIAGKIEKINLSMKNPLEIDANYQNWDAIEYIGHGADEASKRIIELNKAINDTEINLKEFKDEQDHLFDDPLNLDEDTFKLAKHLDEVINSVLLDLNRLKSEKQAIYDDPTNPYGIRSTNEYAEIAPSLGYDGLIFKNLYDSANENYLEPATIMVTFDKDQIHYIETIESTFESGLKELQQRYGDIDEILSIPDNKIKDTAEKFSTGSVAVQDSLIHGGDPIISKLPHRLLYDMDEETGELIAKDAEYVERAMLRFVSKLEENLKKLQDAFSTDATSIEEYNAEKGITDGVRDIGKEYKLFVDYITNFLQGIVEVSEDDIASIREHVNKSYDELEKFYHKGIITDKDFDNATDKFEKFNAYFDNNASKPLEGEPLKGEQTGMDLDKAAQDANELAAAEQKVEAAVEDTNKALDEQAAKVKEAASALDLSKQVGTLNFLAGEAKKAASVLSETTWSDDDKEHYEQLIAIIGTYRKSKEKMTDEELDGIRKIVDGYKMQADAVRQAGEETKKAANVFGLKELKSASDRSINLNALTNGFNSKVITDNLENARQAYQRLIEYQQKFNDGHTATDKEKEAYKVLTNQYNAAAKAVEDLIKKSQKMANDSRWSVEIDPSDLDNLEQSMQKAIQASENGRVKFGQFNAETGKLEYSVRRANGTWDHFTAQVDEAGMAVVGLNGKVKTTNGILREFTSGVSTKFKNAMQVFSGYDLFFEAIAQVKQGIQYVKDIDLALTELKKVTNETDEAYAHFLQTASQTSAVIGSTVADFTNATADFARLNI